MKKLILTLIVSWIGLNLSAQSFDTYIRHNQTEYPSNNLVSLKNNEYVISSGFLISGKYKTVVYKLNSTGTVSDSLTIPYFVTNYIYNDSSVIFTATSTTGTMTNDSIIIGEIEPDSFKISKVNKSPLLSDPVALNDLKFFNYCNCYTLVGSGTSSSGNTRAYIAQFDRRLNLLQEKYYSSQFKKPVFLGVLENSNGDGLWALSEPLDSIAGWQGGVGAVIPIDSNLVRDSTSLNLLLTNQSYISFSGKIGIIPEPFDGVKLTDSTYLFAGRIVTEQLQNGQPVGLEDDMAYLIMDNNLNLVKSEFYGKKDTMDVSAFNTVDRNDNYVYLLHTSYIGGSLFQNVDNFFGLTKVDESGTKLWTKYYSTGNYKIASAVEATPDGGAIMVGTSYDGNKGTGPERDIYVLKVDSNGNRSTTGIKEAKQISHHNFRIYPNPVKNDLHLLKVNDFRNYKFTLFDGFGRKVLEKNWTKNEQLISTANLTSGIYVYRLIDSQGRVASGKIVKQ